MSAGMRRGGRPLPAHDETSCPRQAEITALRTRVVELEDRLQAVGGLAELHHQYGDLTRPT